jgi:hypothetical protein
MCNVSLAVVYVWIVIDRVELFMTTVLPRLLLPLVLPCRHKSHNALLKHFVCHECRTAGRCHGRRHCARSRRLLLGRPQPQRPKVPPPPPPKHHRHHSCMQRWPTRGCPALCLQALAARATPNPRYMPQPTLR